MILFGSFPEFVFMFSCVFVACFWCWDRFLFVFSAVVLPLVLVFVPAPFGLAVFCLLISSCLGLPWFNKMLFQKKIKIRASSSRSLSPSSSTSHSSSSLSFSSTWQIDDRGALYDESPLKLFLVR